jgi:hypothetical protein
MPAPVPAHAFTTPAERVQWLLSEAGKGRALTDEEHEALALFKRAHPQSFYRMKDYANAQQTGPHQERRSPSTRV